MHSPNDGTLGSRLAVVEHSVTGLQAATNKLEGDVARLESTVTAGFATLSKEISSRDKAPWGLLISGVLALIAVMSLIGGLAYAPISTKLDTLATLAAKTDENKVNRREIELLVRYRDLQQSHNQERLERLEKDFFAQRRPAQ